MSDLPLGNVPLSTLDDSDNIIFTEGQNAKKIAYSDMKADMLGSAVLATTAPKTKESINELVQDILDGTGYGVISGLTVAAQSTPNMTVNVVSGPLRAVTGARQNVTGNSALAVTAADATNPRIDIVYVDSTGTIQYLAGTPNASPTAPTTPTGGFKLAEISVAANATSITNANITDKRKMLISTDALNTQLSENTQNIAKLSNKNYAINGNFDNWQRGTSAVNPSTNTFLADRFDIAYTLTGTVPTTLTHSKQTFTAGEVPNSTNFYRLTSDSLGVLNSADSYGMCQPIENGTRKLCGANKKVTVSFWAKSSIANKKLGILGKQSYGTGGSPSSAETLIGSFFTLSSTWQKFSVTLNTNTLVGKTFGTNNDDVLKIWFYYAYGSGASVSFNDTVGELFGNGTIDIAQVKIESGDKATPFVPRLYGEELALCQRYYEKSFSDNIAPASGVPSSNYAIFDVFNGTVLGKLEFKTKKRITPSITFYNPFGTIGNARTWNGATSITVSANSAHLNQCGLNVLNTSDSVTANDKVITSWVADAEIY